MTTVSDLTASGLSHTMVSSSGNRIHVAELGSGPLIVLIHGFPESWYSWRHQMIPLAEAGFRVAAIDVRGYGRSTKPPSVESYAMSILVGDVIAVLDSYNAETATIIGHDWGAPIAWNTAVMRPDRVRAVAGLSVPYSPRGDTEPLAAFRAMAGQDRLFYMDYFQESGLVESDVEHDLAGWLQGFYFSASAEADPTKPMALVPKGQHLRDAMQWPTEGQMAWMTDEDFAFYLNEFQRTGLTGGFNRYRCLTRDWVELAPWRFAPITAPALFLGGDRDGPTQWGAKAIDQFDRNLPNLVDSQILNDCGHWVQQEQPAATTEALVSFAYQTVG